MTGKLVLYSYNLKKSEALNLPSDMGVLLVGRLNSFCFQVYILFIGPNMDIEIDKIQTRKVRIYKNIPLVAFVEEMSRLEGFTIKRWDCVTNQLVTVAVYYQSAKEEVYSAINDFGVLLYEEKGIFSLCPEDEKNKIAMIERRKHDKQF